MDFDFGVDLAESAGGFTRENPKVGPHMARVRDILHIGTIGDSRYPDKKPTPRAVIVFELLEEHDVDSQGNRLLYPHMINMVKGDNSFLNSKFLPAVVSAEEFKAGSVKGFDDIITRPCQLELTGSDQTYKDEKTGEELPKYINLGSITTLHPKLVQVLDPLAEGNLGHVRLADFKKDSLDILNMFMHIQEGIMKSDEWKSGAHPAIPMIEEIRKERPNFAKAKSKDEAKGQGANGSGAQQQQPQTGSAAPEKLDSDEEF